MSSEHLYYKELCFLVVTIVALFMFQILDAFIWKLCMMEINDSDTANLHKAKVAGSQCNIRADEAIEGSDFDPLNVTENLSDNLLTQEQNDDVSFCSDTEGNYDESLIVSNTKNNAKEPVESEIPRSIFHLSDNMKKDLSLLTFPSKSHARKKTVISSRITPNSRITIAEALEKAEDARKSMSNLHKSSDHLDNLKGKVCNSPHQSHSTPKILETGGKESQDVTRTLTPNHASDQDEAKMKLDTAVTTKNVSDGCSPSDTVEEAASCSEGRRVDDHNINIFLMNYLKFCFQYY